MSCAPGAAAETEGVRRGRAGIRRAEPTNHPPAHVAEHVRPDHGEPHPLVADAIVAESTFTFLGFGIQPPQSIVGPLLSDNEGAVNDRRRSTCCVPGPDALDHRAVRELRRRRFTRRLRPANQALREVGMTADFQPSRPTCSAGRSPRRVAPTRCCRSGPVRAFPH